MIPMSLTMHTNPVVVDLNILCSCAGWHPLVQGNVNMNVADLFIYNMQYLVTLSVTKDK
jgi:hypothetical protein